MHCSFALTFILHPNGLKGRHKHSRTKSSVFCAEVLFKRPNEQNNLIKIGEHNSVGVFENWVGTHCLQLLWLTLQIWRQYARTHISTRTTYFREGQHSSRQSRELSEKCKCYPSADYGLSSRSVCFTSLTPIRALRWQPDSKAIQNSSTTPHTQIGRLESIRDHFATAFELLSSSFKASTSKSYNCSWPKWSSKLLCYTAK